VTNFPYDPASIDALGVSQRVRRRLHRHFSSRDQLRAWLEHPANHLSDLWGIGAKGEHEVLTAMARTDTTFVPPPRRPTPPLPEPTAEDIAAIKRETPGYGASIDWQNTILRIAWQAGFVAGRRRQRRT
jgi:hypothetical protein